MLRFSPRSGIFKLKADETFWTRQVVNYSIKSKGYFGKDKSKEEFLTKFWLLWWSKISGHFATSTNSTWSLMESHHLALGGCSTLHQQSTERNLGLSSFWGSIPLLLQLNFELLFLVYLIHIFRIWEHLVKAIKLHSED